jgi:hypothetical protein
MSTRRRVLFGSGISLPASQLFLRKNEVSIETKLSVCKSCVERSSNSIIVHLSEFRLVFRRPPKRGRWKKRRGEDEQNNCAQNRRRTTNSGSELATMNAVQCPMSNVQSPKSVCREDGVNRGVEICRDGSLCGRLGLWTLDFGTLAPLVSCMIVRKETNQ